MSVAIESTPPPVSHQKLAARWGQLADNRWTTVYAGYEQRELTIEHNVTDDLLATLGVPRAPRISDASVWSVYHMAQKEEVNPKLILGKFMAVASETQRYDRHAETQIPTADMDAQSLRRNAINWLKSQGDGYELGPIAWAEQSLRLAIGKQREAGDEGDKSELVLNRILFEHIPALSEASRDVNTL